jgi:hypothetical protein
MAKLTRETTVLALVVPTVLATELDLSPVNTVLAS